MIVTLDSRNGVLRYWNICAKVNIWNIITLGAVPRTTLSLTLSLPAAFPYVDSVPPLLPRSSGRSRKEAWRIFFSSLGQLGAISQQATLPHVPASADTAAPPPSARAVDVLDQCIAC